MIIGSRTTSRSSFYNLLAEREKDVIRVAPLARREDSATAGHFAISIHGSRDDEGGTEEGSGAVSWFGSFGIEKSLQ